MRSSCGCLDEANGSGKHTWGLVRLTSLDGRGFIRDDYGLAMGGRVQLLLSRIAIPAA